jgi:hypothetical protein
MAFNIRKDQDFFSVVSGTESVATFWYGRFSAHAEAEALEAAEYMKAFFEGKQASKHTDADPFIIAKIAALIFAHNCHDFDERRAVESAAKIVELSRNHEK